MGEHIKVALPLSLTRSSELLQAVGNQWPGATIVTDTGEDRYMVIDPDGDGAEPRTTAEQMAQAVSSAADRPTSRPADDDIDAYLTSMRDGSLGISTPEWFARMMFEAYRDILDANDAPNYVEQSMYAVDTGETYVVTVGRPGAKTPHQLRVEAETRAELAEAALEELAGGCGIVRTDTGWCSTNGPLTDATAAALDAATGVEGP